MSNVDEECKLKAMVQPSRSDPKCNDHDSIVIHLARNKRWRDLQTLLVKRDEYYINNEANSIICCVLIEQILTKIFGTAYSTKMNLNDATVSLSELFCIFNQVFDNTLNEKQLRHLCRKFMGKGWNEQDIDFAKLLNHIKFPLTVLSLYSKCKDDEHDDTFDRTLSNIFDDKPVFDKKVDAIFVRIQPPWTKYESNVSNDGAYDDESNDSNDTTIITSLDTQETPSDVFTEISKDKHDKFTIWLNKNVQQQSNPFSSEVAEKFHKEHWEDLLKNGTADITDSSGKTLSINLRTKAWLCCDLRLDGIHNKEQHFTISGWINVIWKEPKHSILYDALVDCYQNEMGSQNVWHFKEKKFKMRLLDLRQADKISYYLPIDARKIFDQLSVKWIEYKDPPYLLFDRQTGVVITEYNICAQLSEHLELFWFPFDKQFLNIKLRWNVDYYKILDWKTGYKQEFMEKDGRYSKKIPDIEHIDTSRRYQENYYNHPCKLHVVEELQNDYLLHETWVGTKQDLEIRDVRFALIRLRLTRNPLYYLVDIIFPLFVIQSSAFSVFALDIDEVGDRLGVSLTVLLTFAAFQSIRSEQLPATAEISALDLYILVAYFIQIAIIVNVVLQQSENGDAASDTEFGWTLFWIWIVVSCLYGGITFMWIVYMCRESCYYEDAECSLCDKIFWDKRSEKELEEWNKRTKSKNLPYVMQLNYNVNGGSRSNRLYIPVPSTD